MDLYIYSKKIVNGDFLDLFVIAQPISLMDKIRKLLVFSTDEDIDCSDFKGSINLNLNRATNHFFIYGKDKKKIFESMADFCSKQNIFFLDITDKESLQEIEKIFFNKNKKTKKYIDSLKDDYDIHKANKKVFKMAECIKEARDIVSGKIKVH